MGRISLLVKDNLKSPPLALLQPRAPQRAKTNIRGDCVQWTTKSRCSRRDTCGMKHDPENKRESKVKGKGSQQPSSPRSNSLERGTLTGKSSSRKEKPSQHASPFARVIVQTEMHVITGIHLRVRLIKKKNYKLGRNRSFKHTEKSGSEPKKRNTSVVVATTLDYTQAEEG